MTFTYVDFNFVCPQVVVAPYNVLWQVQRHDSGTNVSCWDNNVWCVDAVFSALFFLFFFVQDRPKFNSGRLSLLVEASDCGCRLTKADYFKPPSLTTDISYLAMDAEFRCPDVLRGGGLILFNHADTTEPDKPASLIIWFPSLAHYKCSHISSGFHSRLNISSQAEYHFIMGARTSYAHALDPNRNWHNNKRCVFFLLLLQILPCSESSPPVQSIMILNFWILLLWMASI